MFWVLVDKGGDRLTAREQGAEASLRERDGRRMKRTSGLELAFIRIPHQGCLLNAQARHGQEVIMVKPKSQTLSFSNSLWLITVLGLLTVMLVMFVTDHRATPRTVGAGSSVGPNPSMIAEGFVQNPSMTPGDVLTTDRTQICTPGYTKTVRNVPSSLKHQVYHAYGIPTHKPGDYEIDHLISLELGGSNSVRNLWPESFKSQPLNAHVKDEIENKLHVMICNGQIGVSQAQQEIAHDWTVAYTKYIGPLPR
jgi:hypothetical protein